ncbi:MAG: hypothetical protein GXO60_07875 [Epsilonproteobacteria bacterium]|nr:hypothetical protein [Campylobacterota bacterium]
MKDKEDDKLDRLIKQGNLLLDEHLKKYGYLRGFKKPIVSLLQNELDGGDEREVNAFEINEYKLPR